MTALRLPLAATLAVLFLGACLAPEPEYETICVTHSIEATGGGLTECSEVPRQR